MGIRAKSIWIARFVLAKTLGISILLSALEAGFWVPWRWWTSCLSLCLWERPCLWSLSKFVSLHLTTLLINIYFSSLFIHWNNILGLCGQNFKYNMICNALIDYLKQSVEFFWVYTHLINFWNLLKLYIRASLCGQNFGYRVFDMICNAFVEYLKTKCWIFLGLCLFDQFLEFIY